MNEWVKVLDDKEVESRTEHSRTTHCFSVDLSTAVPTNSGEVRETELPRQESGIRIGS